MSWQGGEGHLSLTPQHFDALLAGADAIGTAMAAHLRGEQMPGESMTAILARLNETATKETDPGIPRTVVETSEGEPVASLPQATEQISGGDVSLPSEPSPQALVSYDSRSSLQHHKTAHQLQL